MITRMFCYAQSWHRWTGSDLRLPLFSSASVLVLFTMAHAPKSYAGGFAAQRVVVGKTIEALPEPLSDYFATMRDALLERAVEPGGLWQREPKYKNRDQWTYVYLDAASDSIEQTARVEAAEVFPIDQVKARGLMRKHKIKRGGELPWALQNLTADLAGAFESGDRESVAIHTGHLIGLCAYAADPFRVTRNRTGDETGNAQFGLAEMGDPLYAHQNASQRFGWELVRRYQHRYQGMIDVGQFRYPLGQDAGQLIFKTMLLSLDDLGILCDADQKILGRMQITQAAEFLNHEDEYYELLDEAQGERAVEMLRRGTRLAIALIYQAYQQAGEPSLLQSKPMTLAAMSDTPDPDPQIDNQANAGESTKSAATSSEEKLLTVTRIASKNSKVFHLPTCTHVKRISAKNRVEYENEDAAVGSGKRRCNSCFSKS